MCVGDRGHPRAASTHPQSRHSPSPPEGHRTGSLRAIPTPPSACPKSQRAHFLLCAGDFLMGRRCPMGGGFLGIDGSDPPLPHVQAANVLGPLPRRRDGGGRLARRHFVTGSPTRLDTIHTGTPAPWGRHPRIPMATEPLRESADSFSDLKGIWGPQAAPGALGRGAGRGGGQAINATPGGPGRLREQSHKPHFLAKASSLHCSLPPGKGSLPTLLTGAAPKRPCITPLQRR